MNCYRVTAEGGVVVWVVQDQVKNGRESGSSLRQRLYFESIGFRPYATLIMQSNGFRFPHKTRYPQQFQYGFVFAKGKPRVVNLIQDRPNSTVGGRVKQSVRDKDGKSVIVTRPGKRVRPFGLRSNIWTYDAGYGKTTKDKVAYKHPALMPDAMAEDLIISFSKPGDLVFDPMCGSGTTLKMALLNDRDCLGMEIHEPYWEIAVKRLELARQQHKQKLDEFLSGLSTRNGGRGTNTPEVPPKAADWDQTPEQVCREIIGLIPWAEDELVLEPFRGDGNFYNNLPDSVRKDWCEIKEGRDFFNYSSQPDTIITNPPFRDQAGGNNMVVPCLERCLQLARKRVVFFVNHKSLNSLTAARLKKYEQLGWGIRHFSVWDTKKWFGRYFLIVWEKNTPSIVGYFPANEQGNDADCDGAAVESESCSRLTTDSREMVEFTSLNTDV